MFNGTYLRNHPRTMSGESDKACKDPMGAKGAKRGPGRRPKSVPPNPIPSTSSSRSPSPPTPSASERPEPQSKLDNPWPFEVRSIPNKGQGAIATSNIKRGQLILSERPIFIYRAEDHPEDDDKDTEQRISDCVAGLSLEDKEKVLRMTNCHGDLPPHYGLFHTNAIPCDEEQNGGIFDLGCRFNHSCCPNASAAFWRRDKQMIEIHALADIQEGEEICWMYLELSHKVRKSRQRQLKKDFRFDCGCTLCSLPPREVLQSDAHRKEMVYLKALRRIWSRTDPKRAIESVDRSIELAELEGQHALKSWTYLDAARICARWSDWKGARLWSRKALGEFVIEKGRESENARETMELIRDPKGFEDAGKLGRKYLSRDRES